MLIMSVDQVNGASNLLDIYYRDDSVRCIGETNLDPGDLVMKPEGRAGGPTYGLVCNGVEAELQIRAPLIPGGPLIRTRETCVVERDTANMDGPFSKRFSEQGDSGAFVFKRQGGYMAAGMIFAGADCDDTGKGVYYGKDMTAVVDVPTLKDWILQSTGMQINMNIDS